MIASADPVALNSQLSALSSSPKITCLILAYNEEARIRTALSHATRWADEVIVLDKESTDRTIEIVHRFADDSGLSARGGAPGQSEIVGQTPGPQQRATVRVHHIPFSRQGHERYEDMVAPASNDWVWHFTPGEVPTPRVIYAAKELLAESDSQPSTLNSQLALIRIPTKLWSFGVHDPRSPWGIGYQPRLYHKGRVQFTGICHYPIEAAENRTAMVPVGEDCYVFHPTHPTADAFIRSHADYCVNEAAKDLPERVLAQAFYQIQAHDQAFRQNPDLLCQQIAWQIYWLQTALHAAERHRARDIPAEYRALTDQALQAWSVKQ